MTGSELLARLDELGVELTLAGDRIRYRSRAGTVPPELLAQIREHRDELGAVLARRERLLWPPAGDPARSGDRSGPLTESQRTLWATNHLVDDGTFNLCGALRLRGPLDRAAFTAALADLVERHASLRTVFPVEHGEPRQRILATAATAPVDHDLSDLPADAAYAECLRQCADLADRLLPLDPDPPVRLHLFRLADDDHVFFVVLHHVVADGVSFGILIDDLARCYNARLDGAAAPARPHDTDMIDYAVWEEEFQRYGNLAAPRHYWSEALAGAPPPPVPIPAPGAGSARARGAARQIVVDPDTTAAVRALAATGRASAFLVVAAAVATVLSSVTGRDDLVVGMPVARRDQDGLADLVGLLLDTVPVRLDLTSAPAFLELVHQARRSVLGALTHRFAPQATGPGTRGGPKPAERGLFNILVTDAGKPLEAASFTGLAVSEVEVQQIGAKFDLNFLVRDLGGTLRVDVEFDRETVGDQVIAALAAGIATVLARACADPSLSVAALAAEVRPEQPAAAATATADAAGAQEPPADSRAVAALHDLYREVLRDGATPTGPDPLDRADDSVDFFDLGGDSMRAIKLVSLARERGLDFSLRDVYERPVLRDLATRAVLQEDAPDPGPSAADRFGLLPPGSAASFGPQVQDAYPMTALQVGMVYHQEIAPQSRVYHNLLSVRVGGIMRPAAFRAAVQAVVARHPVLRTSFELGHVAGPVQRVHTAVEVPVRFEDLTGLDAARQSRRIDEVLAAERATDFDLETAPLLRFVVLSLTADEYQLVFSHHHILLDGWSVNILFDDLHRAYRQQLDGAADTGEPLRGRLADYVAREQAALSDPDEEAYWRQRATTTAPLLTPPTATPPAMRRLSIDFAPGTIADLRPAATAAGVPLKALLLAAHVRVLAWLLGADDIVTGLVLTCRPEGPDADRLLGLFLNELPMCTRLGDPTWAQLARQVHAEELSMLEHRWYPHAAVLKQRDQGPLFDSYFNFTDFHTTKRMLEEDLRLLDALELEFTHYALGVNFTVDLRSHELRLILEYDTVRLDSSTARLAAEAYRRVVAAIVADLTAPVRRAALPGVLDQARLLHAFDEEDDQRNVGEVPVVAEPAPVPAVDDSAAPSPLEDSVRRTWIEVLGPGEYPADRDFFSAGGDSLTAMRVVSRLRAQHGAFSMRTFTEAPTIAATARALLANDTADDTAGEAITATVSGEGEGGDTRWPVTTGQHQLWQLATRLPQVPLFGVPATFRMDGPVDLDVLRKAFAALVARHDALRTRFVPTPTGVEQIVEAHAELPITVTDLTGHAEPLVESERLMVEAARVPFALDRAPLMRVAVYRVADESFVVYLSLHHIICDGWSMALMQRELTGFYQQLSTGGPAARPTVPGAGAVAAGRIAWSRSPAADEQRRYWSRQLAAPRPALSDPAVSRVRPTGPVSLMDSFAFRYARRLVDAGPAEALRKAGTARGHTEFMLLVAAYAAGLASISGQPDIRIATMVANRGEPGTEDVLGLLANTVVLRLRVDPGADPVALTRQAHQVCAEAYGRQELPFEDVLESLAAPDAGPLYEVMLLQQDELTGVTVDGVELSPFRPRHTILATTLAPSTNTMTLVARTGHSGIELGLQYKPAAVAPEVAEDLLDAVAAWLTDVARAL
ncbi:condensation domain-containing protein [Hamadaea tsunoensis]|uniref:condensation domain-containing protein n=1 Tax=Hamadaea tsunoensis TaxID=53368 RepID=UPI0004153C26|nr:condensation domain-containing protein [Hamadaea tsunoensis]